MGTVLVRLTVLLAALAVLGGVPTSIWGQTVGGTPGSTTIPGLDSVVRHPTYPDSIKRPRPDSIKAPFGRGIALPASIEVGAAYTFTREQLFASGTLTLTDLLDRVPGVTTFTSGWLASPHVAAYYGDMSHIKVYYDGVQIDNLESRNGQVMDLSTIPLWSLDHVTIAREANDLRVDVQSWQYNLTTPYTRADVLTGDLSTDMYRAFYGKRFYNGASLQVAAQQIGTTDNRLGGGGDALSFFGRYGIARPMWSMDVTVNRSNTTRSIIDARSGGGELLPDYRARNTIAYIRAALGKVGSGPFLQLVAANLGVQETSSHFNTASASQYGFPPDTVDSAASLSQYVATTGFDAQGFRLRLIDRYRTQGGAHFNGETASLDYTARVLSFNALVERDPYYGYTDLEGGVRFSPLSVLAISGVVGERRTDPARTTQPYARSTRVDAGIRLFGGTWLSAGVISRDTALLVPPIVFDSAFRYSSAGRTHGTIFSLRGSIGYGFSVDAAGTTWKNPTAYLPKDQAHVELKYFTEWLSKFPNHSFSFFLSSTLDYRSQVAFPDSSGAIVPSIPYRYTALPSYVYSLQAEIRILRGVITYQRRNTDLLIYDQVPGFIMPRGVNLYGVRWYFFD